MTNEEFPFPSRPEKKIIQGRTQRNTPLKKGQELMQKMRDQLGAAKLTPEQIEAEQLKATDPLRYRRA